MKKILSGIMAGVMAVSLCGCFGGYERDSESSQKQEQVQKTFGVGDTQTIDGVNITLTEVKTQTQPINFVSSDNGYFVRVFFEVEKLHDKYFVLYGSDFRLNDTYTIRDCAFCSKDLNGGINLLQGNVYSFEVIFDSSYSHEGKDLTFIWDNGGIFGKTRKWVI
jgi:hypothetical protein